MCHPGVVDTNIMEHLIRPILYKIGFYAGYWLFWYFTKNPYQGAQTAIHLAVCPFEKLENGSYYVDCKVGWLNKKAKNKEANKKLWEITEKLVAVKNKE